LHLTFGWSSRDGKKEESEEGRRKRRGGSTEGGMRGRGHAIVTYPGTGTS
jgi:hypothetical protein